MWRSVTHSQWYASMMLLIILIMCFLFNKTLTLYCWKSHLPRNRLQYYLPGLLCMIWVWESWHKQSMKHTRYLWIFWEYDWAFAHTARNSHRGLPLHTKHCQSSDWMSVRTERFKFRLMQLYNRKQRWKGLLHNKD